jgi:exodeoxyribonuclease VII large subunit
MDLLAPACHVPAAHKVTAVETHTHSVAELNALISDALTGAFPDQVWVQGEIHGYSTSARGHTYFNLVEPGQLGRPSAATLSVVLFGGNRRAVDHVLAKAGGLALADGLEVRIRGEVLFYPPQGRVQLRMTAIDPRHTLGKLTLDRDQLLRVLAAEGLLDRNRARPLSPVPLRVGLVTSEASAAAHDLLDELTRSGFGWKVSLIDTRVQGEGAVDGIVTALRTASRLDLDVVAVVRGGGSRSDLAAFDHEAVARAIATMPVPVITGIGHEIDESVADRVAYRSFKTPTACAGFLCDAVSSYRARCDELWRGLAVRSLDLLEHHDAALRSAAARAASGARTTLELGTARVIELRTAMTREPERALDRSERHVDALERHVGALDPARVLARGWSITRTAEGALVRGVADAPPGTALATRVHDGTVHSTVDPTGDDR